MFNHHIFRELKIIICLAHSHYITILPYLRGSTVLYGYTSIYQLPKTSDHIYNEASFVTL